MIELLKEIQKKQKQNKSYEDNNLQNNRHAKRQANNNR